MTKLDVNLWEIWRKFKCRRSMSYPFELIIAHNVPSTYSSSFGLCTMLMWLWEYLFKLFSLTWKWNLRVFCKNRTNTKSVMYIALHSHLFALHLYTCFNIDGCLETKGIAFFSVFSLPYKACLCLVTFIV